MKVPSMDAANTFPMDEALVATLFNSFDVELDLLKQRFLELKEPSFFCVSSLLLPSGRLQQLEDGGRGFGDVEPERNCSSEFLSFDELSWESEDLSVAGLGLEASGLWVTGSIP